MQPNRQPSGDGESSPNPGQRRTILYEKKVSDDNYTDETFLSSLKMSESPKPFTYLEGVVEAMQIAAGLSNVAYYLFIYARLKAEVQNRSLARATLLITLTLSTFAGILFLMFKSGPVNLSTTIQNVARMGILLALIYFSSPFFMAANSHIGDETIYWIVGFFMSFHLYFRDYSYQKQTTFEVHKSVMAVLFVNAFLSSRMQYSEQVAAIWVLGLMLFFQVRFILISIKATYHLLFNFVIFVYIIVPVFIAQDMAWLYWTYLASIFFVVLVCPLWFLSLFEYKNIIEGPWDIPNIKSYD